MSLIRKLKMGDYYFIVTHLQLDDAMSFILVLFP